MDLLYCPVLTTAQHLMLALINNGPPNVTYIVDKLYKECMCISLQLYRDDVHPIKTKQLSHPRLQEQCCFSRILDAATCFNV